MAQSREIEKLQRRWQENPLGLTFAPLAEAYRKEGLFPEALELLEIGLTHHPNYVPAHIVCARCHLDNRNDHLAQAAFERVTALDPENVIALQGLAEIAERAGRYQEALDCLNRLLEFDRTNEEAGLQLQRVRARLAIPDPSLTELDQLAVQEPAAPAQAGLTPSEQSEKEDSTASATARAEAEPAAESEAGPPAPEFELHDPVALEPESASRRAPNDSEELRPALAAGLGQIDLGVVGSPVPEGPAIPAAVAPSAPEPSLGNAVESAAGFDPWLDPDSPDGGHQSPIQAEQAPEGEPEPTAPDRDVAPSVVSGPAADEGSEDPSELDGGEPELVVTETMADVFLRQGHRELALAVYSQLLSRDPDNARVRAVANRLEAELRPLGSAPSLPVYAAVLTGGQSVRSYFEILLSATRPGAGQAAAPEISLGAVFDDENAADEARRPAPTPDDEGESFDQFFGEEVGPGPSAADQALPSAAPVEDIEEFNTWLRGLKR